MQKKQNIDDKTNTEQLSTISNTQNEKTLKKHIKKKKHINTIACYSFNLKTLFKKTGN